jgi:hypothetical protein
MFFDKIATFLLLFVVFENWKFEIENYSPLLDNFIGLLLVAPSFRNKFKFSKFLEMTYLGIWWCHYVFLSIYIIDDWLTSQPPASVGFFKLKFSWRHLLEVIWKFVKFLEMLSLRLWWRHYTYLIYLYYWFKK